MAIYDTRTPGAPRPLGHVEIGPGVGADLDRRLLGAVRDRHVLVLGCGAGHDAVGLALRGAHVTAVDPDADQLAHGRRLAADEEVVVRFRECEPADLAFIPGDRMDLVVSVHSLAFVDDLDRVFRQVHRVLKHAAHFVVSLPHPALLNSDPSDPVRTVRRWDGADPIGARWAHRAEDVVTALHRANFGIDTLLELHAPDGSLQPATLVARGVKVGS